MADDTNGPREKVRFVFRKAPDCRTIAANGAYGGLTPRGDVHMHLFIESPAVPEVTEMVPEEDGSPGPETAVSPKAEEGIRAVVEREVQVGVLMSPSTARLLGRWLLTRCEEWESLRDQFGSHPLEEDDGENATG